ncbi:phiKZ-like phage internal head protein [compost metagenome]
MLNLSTYVPSLENFEQVPSPLMDGDAAPVEGAIVGQLPTEGFPVPVEQPAVELPPALDPTPLQPLEAGIIQEEVIAENLDAEAGQLMGAQIALEGYSKLLRSAGKNMTRQSAAFMAVGMSRTNRILGVTSIGLENEESGTQVMAMQTANVDKKGLGEKLKAAGAKIWDWLKQKAKQLMDALRKALSRKKTTQAEVVYLIAATSAIESGNPGKVKGLEAPSGIKVAQVLDAIHGEDIRAPKQQSVQLPGALVPYLTKGGKLDLNLSAEHEFRSKVMVGFIKDATALLNDITSLFTDLGKGTTPEEVADNLSDLIKKHLGGKAGKWELHGMTVERTAEGKLVITKPDPSDATEVQLPSLPEIRKYLDDVKVILDSDLSEGEAAAKAYEAAQEKMMQAGDAVDAKFPEAQREEIIRAMSKVMHGNSFEDSLGAASNHLDRISTAAAKGCDFFLATYLGKGNTISQEDYLALPSPAGKQGIGSAVKAAWAKTKEFFARLWAQFKDWCARIWARIFGEEKKVDMLLLTNEAITEEGGPATGEPLALPPGTGLKSVSAAKSIAGPSAPAETPIDVTPEPVVDTSASLPNGFIHTPALAKLQLGSGYAFEPTIEEAYITWFTNTYNPAVVKMWRDVISMTNSNFDVSAMDNWGSILTNMASKVMAGAPTGEIPGGQSLILNEGTIAFSFDRGEAREAEPVKALNKRQIAQILARQKRAFIGLKIAQKGNDEQERLHEQFAQVIDRLMNNADDAKGSEYGAFYSAVNRLMCNTAVRQLASSINSSFNARTIVMDEMIAARAKRG